MSPTPQTIPVNFTPEVQPEVTPKKELFAITEQEAIEKLSLDKACRNYRAAQDAFRIFRHQHKIKPLPGFVFSVKQLERAMQ